MPKIEIRWASSGVRHVDEAAADKIADFAMELLAYSDPDASVDLGAPGLGEAVQP